MTQRERQILQWIEADPMISQEALAERAGITRSSVAVHISNLMKKGYIAGKGYVLRSGTYAAVVGGVNVDIGGQSYAPLVARDSNPGPRAHQPRRRRTKYCPQHEPARRGCPPADRLRRRPACTARCGLLRRARHRHQPRAAGARRHDVHLPFPERRRRRYGAWPFRHGYLRAHHPRLSRIQPVPAEQRAGHRSPIRTFRQSPCSTLSRTVPPLCSSIPSPRRRRARSSPCSAGSTRSSRTASKPSFSPACRSRTKPACALRLPDCSRPACTACSSPLGTQGVFAADQKEMLMRRASPRRCATPPVPAMPHGCARLGLSRGHGAAETARAAEAAAAIAIEGEETINPAMSADAVRSRMAAK